MEGRFKDAGVLVKLASVGSETGRREWRVCFHARSPAAIARTKIAPDQSFQAAAFAEREGLLDVLRIGCLTIGRSDSSIPGALVSDLFCGHASHFSHLLLWQARLAKSMMADKAASITTKMTARMMISKSRMRVWMENKPSMAARSIRLSEELLLTRLFAPFRLVAHNVASVMQIPQPESYSNGKQCRQNELRKNFLPKK